MQLLIIEINLITYLIVIFFIRLLESILNASKINETNEYNKQKIKKDNNSNSNAVYFLISLLSVSIYLKRKSNIAYNATTTNSIIRVII